MIAVGLLGLLIEALLIDYPDLTPKELKAVVARFCQHSLTVKSAKEYVERMRPSLSL